MSEKQLFNEIGKLRASLSQLQKRSEGFISSAGGTVDDLLVVARLQYSGHDSFPTDAEAGDTLFRTDQLGWYGYDGSDWQLLGGSSGGTPSPHASTHLPGGADPLTYSTTPVEITDATNAVGDSESFALSNHQHAHGTRGGGTLHAVATDSVAGFMSSADKSKLDGIETSATADQTITAGAGLIGGGAGDVTLDVGAGGGVSVSADAVAVDETYAFTWTGLHTFQRSAGGVWAYFEETAGVDCDIKVGHAGYGWYWRYLGTGSGNDNELQLWSEGAGGTDVQVYGIKQDGTWDFKQTVTVSGTAVSLVGHTHDDRYYTESEVDTLLAGYSVTGHTHDDRYYTESEVDALLAGYSQTSHTHDDRYYTETEVDALLAGYSVTGHTHDDRYYTESEVDTLLTGYSVTGHTHDDRYYTESEVDTLLVGKSDTGHIHAHGDLSGVSADQHHSRYTDSEAVSAVDGATITHINFTNNEEGAYTTSGDVYFDASVGLYVVASNVGGGGSHAIWNSGNVTAGSGINITEDSEQKPTLAIDGNTVSVKEGCKVYRTSNLSVSNETWTTISFHAEHRDDNSMWSSGNASRLYAATDGWHAATLTVKWNVSTGGHRKYRVVKNGTDVIARDEQGPAFAGYDQYGTFSAAIYLEAGDYIEFVSWQNSGGALALKADTNYCVTAALLLT